MKGRKMKIMFAVATYWPFRDGVAQVTGYLAEGLAGKGHEVLVYTSTGNQDLPELSENEVHEGVRIQRIRVYTHWPLTLRGLDSKSTPEEYFRRVQTYSPDVLIVVCAQIWTLDWLVPYLDQIKCAKVFYSHGYSALREKYDIWGKLKKRNIVGAWEQYRIYRYYKNLYKIIEKFDLALYLLEENNSALYAQEHGITNGKILRNAVDDRFFEEEMQHGQKEGGSVSGIQYLHVGNYNDNKNQMMLLQAYARADIGKSKLVLVGSFENEYLQRLRKEAKELLDNQPQKEVEFKVHIEREEVYRLYRESDVFVCASKSENSPVVLFEAAATGMPVVSTKVGSAEKMDGIILVKDSDDLAGAMKMLYYDGDARRQKGKLLKEYVELCSSRIQDKVNWLEKELSELCVDKTEQRCNEFESV